ncbi:MAG: hypothetical protein ABI778_05580, partial [Ignavibacteriota bacterium]
MKIRLIYLIPMIVLAFASCNSPKQVVKPADITIATPPAVTISRPIKYRMHFVALGSMTLPHDEFWIDTTGQMTFETH